MSMESVVTILNRSQRCSAAGLQSRRKFDTNVAFSLNKFRLVSTLSEHHGCINRLAWNDDGSLLASCSDDLRVCIWSAETGNLVSALPTSHTNNIFGVRFLPQTENRFLITGGIDGLVELHGLSEDWTTRTKAEQYYCHRSRVKYVETEPMSSFMFFSCGEDGCVRQYDTRLPKAGCIRTSGEHGMGSMFNSTNCLVSYKPMTKTMSVRINPVDTNLMVVATSDSQVHMYDRRMLTPTSFYYAGRVKPTSSFAPAHLLSDSRAYGTFADFSPDGRSILATFHSDHTYIFDIYATQDTNSYTNNTESKMSRVGDPAPLPWRCRDEDQEAFIAKASEAVELGKKMLDYGLNVSSYSVLSRAEEMTSTLLHMSGAAAGNYHSSTCTSSAAAVSSSASALPQDRRPAPVLGEQAASAFRIKKQTSEKIIDLHVKNLYYRALVACQRKFKGDDSAALNDLDRALMLRPKVKECMLKRAELLVRLQRSEEAMLQLTDLRSELEVAKANNRPASPPPGGITAAITAIITNATAAATTATCTARMAKVCEENDGVSVSGAPTLVVADGWENTIKGEDKEIKKEEGDMSDLLPSIEADMNALLAIANEQLHLRQKTLQQHRVREKFRKNPNLLRQDFVSMLYPPVSVSDAFERGHYTSTTGTTGTGPGTEPAAAGERSYIAALTVEGLERHTAASTAIHGSKRLRGELIAGGSLSGGGGGGAGGGGGGGGNSEGSLAETTPQLGGGSGASSLRAFHHEDEAHSLAEAERLALADAAGVAPPFRSHKRRAIETTSSQQQQQQQQQLPLPLPAAAVLSRAGSSGVLSSNGSASSLRSPLFSAGGSVSHNHHSHHVVSHPHSDSARTWIREAAIKAANRGASTAVAATAGNTSTASVQQLETTAASADGRAHQELLTTATIAASGSGSGSSGGNSLVSSVYSNIAACAMYYDRHTSASSSTSTSTSAPLLATTSSSSSGASGVSASSSSSSATNPPNSSSEFGEVITKYTQRFVGSANIATDMKEASFFGPHGEFIVSGSDDGHLFIWDRYSGEILLCRAGDPDLLSCVQPHPTLPLMATAGLDDVVRIWGPAPLRGRLGGSNDAFRGRCGTLSSLHHYRPSRHTGTTNDDEDASSSSSTRSSSFSSGGGEDDTSSSRSGSGSGLHGSRDSDNDKWGNSSSSHWSVAEEDSNSINSNNEQQGSLGGGRNTSHRPRAVGRSSVGAGDSAGVSDSNNESDSGSGNEGNATALPARATCPPTSCGSDNSEDNDNLSISSCDRCEPYEEKEDNNRERQLPVLGKKRKAATGNIISEDNRNPHHHHSEGSNGSVLRAKKQANVPADGDQGSDSGRSSGAGSHAGSSSSDGSGRVKSQDGGSDAGSRASHNSSNQSSNDSSNVSSSNDSNSNSSSSNTSSNNASSAPSNSSDGHTTREGHNNSSVGSNDSHSGSASGCGGSGSSAGHGSGSGSDVQEGEGEGEGGSNDGMSSQEDRSTVNGKGLKRSVPRSSNGHHSCTGMKRTMSSEKNMSNNSMSEEDGDGSSGNETTSNDDDNGTAAATNKRRKLASSSSSLSLSNMKAVASSNNLLTVTSSSGSGNSSDVDGSGSSSSGSNSGSDEEASKRTQHMLSLTAARRRLMDQAMKGYPMSGEEAMVLEKIVTDNQKLMQYGPMPLFYQQVLGSATEWNDGASDLQEVPMETMSGGGEMNQQCTQS